MASTPAGDAVRRSIQTALFRVLRGAEDVVCASLVGSFCEGVPLDSISDVDTVVVVERLSPPVLNRLRNAVLALSGEELGLPGRAVRLNDGFGPRKFDHPGDIVVHLMIYDRAGHRDHVLRSPFTCLDWERTEIAGGTPLAAVYPVLRLQPGDFFRARRGIRNYLEDLRGGHLTFRRHAETADGRLTQVEERHPLDRRHAGEYAFHIMKFLVGNYAKLLAGKNYRPDRGELEAFWRDALPGCASFLPFYRGLEGIKRARRVDFPPETIDTTLAFLEAYSRDLSRDWIDNGRRLVFFRHGQTGLNDGTFLGQGRDPGLLPAPLAAPAGLPQGTVHTSPLRRARETADAWWPAAPARVDPRLAEIDYGQAEGLFPSQVSARFPAMKEAWDRGEDPRFPGGENSADVLRRLECFLADWAASGERDGAAVSHNVVLRGLIGSRLGLPAPDWHLLPVPHLAPVEVRLHRGVFHLDLDPASRERILDAVAARGSRPHVA